MSRHPRALPLIAVLGLAGLTSAVIGAHSADGQTTTVAATVETTTIPATTAVPVVTVPQANDSVTATTVPGSGTTTTSTIAVTTTRPASTTTSTSTSTTTTVPGSGRFMRVVVQVKGDRPGPAAGFGVVFGCNGKGNVDAAIAYPAGAGEQKVEVRTETTRCGIVVNPVWRPGETPAGFFTATMFGPPGANPADAQPLVALPRRDRTGSFGFPFGPGVVVSYWPGQTPLTLRVRAQGGTQAPLPSVNVTCDTGTATVGAAAGGRIINAAVSTPWDRVLDLGSLAWELGCRPGGQVRIIANPPAGSPLKVSFATRAKATGIVSGALVTLTNSQQLDVIWTP